MAIKKLKRNGPSKLGQGKAWIEKTEAGFTAFFKDGDELYTYGSDQDKANLKRRLIEQGFDNIIDNQANPNVRQFGQVDTKQFLDDFFGPEVKNQSRPIRRLKRK